MNTQRTILIAGASAAGIAVALGAFGAHALRPLLAANNHVETYEVAVRYHFYHAIALLVVGLLIGRQGSMPALKWAAMSFISGILLFSGSLYVLALTSIRAVAWLTPVGGFFFLTGWLLTIRALATSKSRTD